MCTWKHYQFWERKLSNYVKNKKTMTMILFTVMVICFGGTCNYSATEPLNLQGYEVNETEMEISCGGIQSESVPSAENFEVELGGNKLTITSVSTVKEAEKPITYYCLVDVSGSMKENQMEQIRLMLHLIADSLKEHDNMVISTLGNEVSNSAVLTEKSAILEEIDKLVISNEDTNLYKGIVETITQLTTGTQINQEKCILIFSDGKDDQKSGITQQEAQDAVKNAQIPIYTVAFVKDAQNTQQLETAKLLGSFARTSAGGKHYAPEVDKISPEDIVADILFQEELGLIITADVSEIKSEKEMLLLIVSYMGENNSEYQDTMEVLVKDLPKSETTQTTEPTTEENQTETEEEPDPKRGKKPQIGLYLAIGAGVLTLIVVIIIMISKLKKKEDKNTETADEKTDKKEEPNSDEQKDKTSISKTFHLEEEVQNQKQYVLRLYAIGYENIMYTISLQEGVETTIGRNDKADIVIACDDRKLSSLHCKFKIENGRLEVTDMDSKNGTYVNGIPIKELGIVSVHNDETIRMGSYEYRVQIEERR